MTHPMQHATDSQSCSKFWIRHSQPSTQMEDHMAKEDKPIPIEELWKKGASIPFTRDYEHHTFFTHKTIPHVTKALITRPIEAFSVKSRTRTSAWRRMVSAYVQCPSISSRSNLANVRDWRHAHSLLAGRRSPALIQRWRPSLPRTQPNHCWRSFTHQSS
jgi:hypothetical protein